MKTTEENILETLEGIYQLLTAGDRSLHAEDRLVEDLELDSLKSMELLVAIEDKFDGVHVFDNPAAQEATTVGDLVSLIFKEAEQR